MSMLYDTISKDPEQAIADLVEFNRASLERRNSFQEQEVEELDDLDNELDEDLDEDEDDDDELDEDLDEDEDDDLDEDDEDDDE